MELNPRLTTILGGLPLTESVTPTNPQALITQLIALLFLLAVPCVVLFTGWEWSPDKLNSTFLWFSRLASQSAGVVAGVFLFAVLILCFRPKLKEFVVLFILVASIMALGAGIKTILKNQFQEPRPYVVWFEKQGLINASEFYQLPHKGGFIKKQDFSTTGAPAWLQGYWAKNTGYSFPSGHSLFAAQWFLIIVALLWYRRAYAVLLFTGAWAFAVLGSRMYLGMHWPQDLMLSYVIAFISVWIASLFWRRWFLEALNKKGSSELKFWK